MALERYIVIVKNRKIVIGCIVVFILISGYYLIVSNKVRTLELLKDTFLVEYGQNISTNSKSYLDLTTKDVAVKEEIYKNARVTINKKIEKEYPDIGEYIGTIVYKQESLSFSIVVQDTTPPSFAPIEDITVPVGTSLSNEQIEEKFIVTDLQTVKMEIDDGGYDGNVPGKYVIKAIARDASGNLANGSYCLTVKTLEQVIHFEDQQAMGTIIGNKEEVTSNGDALNEQSDWWVNLSDKEIRDKVISSLVWKNEWTNTVYHGVEQLTYGFNIEDKAYGGLLLLENPYNVQVGFGFYGGPYCQTYTNTFSLYWQAPRGPGREVNCGEMIINIPKAITGEELYTHYQ